VESDMEDYGVLTDVCINEKDILIKSLVDVLLAGNQVFKIINCVTLSFRNTEMYSRNYVLSYQRK
jgi:hypothetical protein